MSGEMSDVTCPSCGKRVRWEPGQRWRPFCSERCRLIDLGEWFEERHRISEPAEGYTQPEHDEERGRH